ncbi:hypothetical protein JCM9157_3800 [Halalkalibacter akibai JCM 9157]|uniref:Uncharacterized protein n=1 Tax=Halalkalibacter akibai (strain ATCC 43226 / DSM 21942 / CIP 109018 / JCM 9157 / 1139) TaxID=1236973 RepID=W4QWY0_HALA3|nr:hypothetical protein JCM9157_3800 [Halalkalibacter akibai JCM 9157]
MLKGIENKDKKIESLDPFTKKSHCAIFILLRMLNKNLTKLTKGSECSSIGNELSAVFEKSEEHYPYCTKVLGEIDIKWS